MLSEFSRSQKNRMIKSISLISLCFPLCSGQGRVQIEAWTLTLSLGDTNCLMPLTCSHRYEPLYNLQGLGENDIVHPVTDIAEQSSAFLWASMAKSNKGLINSQGQLLRSRDPVPKAESGPCVHQCCVLWFLQQLHLFLVAWAQSLCLSKYLAGCSRRCLRHWDGEGWWEDSVTKCTWKILSKSYMHISLSKFLRNPTVKNYSISFILWFWTYFFPTTPNDV